MQTDALKPCPNPWCASHDRRDAEIFELHKPLPMDHGDHPDKWVVACPVCPMSGPPHNTKAEAIAAWNNRAALASIPTDAGAVDSGMSGDMVAKAEWLWTNLPIRHQTWDGLGTHEKALVCHCVARLAHPPADLAGMDGLVEARLALANWQKYNTDQSDEVVYQAEKLATAIQSLLAQVARLEGENEQLRGVLARWQYSGCPDCSGDCGSANPPVYSCIMQDTRAALENKP